MAIFLVDLEFREKIKHYLTPKEILGADDIKSTLKKIKNLQDHTKSFSKEFKMKKMKLYLSRVGSYIQGVVKDEGFGSEEEEKLWQHAAKKSKLTDGTKMKAIFKRLAQ